ncbi:MAG TPA: beta-phosphoglucomutase family hydrolase [Capillimicrobium sp.]
MLRLPDSIKACLFDLDGVLTTTAKVHFAAWKKMFDAYLRERDGDAFRPFEQADYDAYVDGKPRYDGVRSFLDSRSIEHDETLVRQLGDRKNDLVNQVIAEQGVDPYPGSVRFLAAVREAGLRTAVVSSSANCKAVIEAAGIADELEVRVDGVTIEEEHLKGKPAPDSFLRAAELLGVDKSEAAVFEDALAGVESGRAGDFGLVVGVNRVGQAEALKQHGADIVVDDLEELLG